jgi:hypothetical protein
MLSDDMACFRSVITADCIHEINVNLGKYPHDLPAKVLLDQNHPQQPQDQPPVWVAPLSFMPPIFVNGPWRAI